MSSYLIENLDDEFNAQSLNETIFLIYGGNVFYVKGANGEANSCFPSLQWLWEKICSNTVLPNVKFLL